MLLLATFDLQAFGVGALEDDDDEEVYHRDSMSRYDSVLGGEEPGDGLYGWTAPQQYTKKTGGYTSHTRLQLARKTVSKTHGPH